MNAGNADSLVSIERHTETIGANHEVIDTWSEIGQAWCEIMTPSAKELREGQNQQHNSIQIRMWPQDINHNDRIIFEGEVYELTSVVDKKSYLLIKAEMNEQGS